MGFRVTKKLVDAGYDVRAVEIGEAGKQRLAEAGIEAITMEEGVPGAKVVVMALPDNIIGQVARQISPCTRTCPCWPAAMALSVRPCSPTRPSAPLTGLMRWAFNASRPRNNTMPARLKTVGRMTP